ncbi:hypothetical protein T492DRAFT_480621 [Pavlovales sp. CCMP2436]|nr:hypothetical protein T492DRAFT_480621 [Pavlovales sp. CCMP2436]
MAEMSIDGALLSAVEESHTGSYGIDAPGLGASQFRNGNSYEGAFKDRTMTGKGEYKWTGLGVAFVGEFERNRLRGEGRYLWPDGSVYEGQVFDGLRDGFGVFTGPHSICKYAGHWQAGQRHGHGKLEYDPKGNSWYEGDWQADEKHGQGTMVYKSGNVYAGQWEKNVKCGHGEMRWTTTAEIYKGQWANGLQHGIVLYLNCVCLVIFLYMISPIEML